MYPWYVYQPTRSKEKAESKVKSQRPKKGKGKALTPESDEFVDYSSTDNESVVSSASSISVSSFVFPSSARRASSMPTPPPAIKLPQLLPTAPSCPSSPLTPLTAPSRRRGQFLHAVPTNNATHFRFLSNEAMEAASEQVSYLCTSDKIEISPGIFQSSPSMYPSLYDAPLMPMLDQTNNGGESASSSRRGSLASLSIPGTPPNTFSAFPQHQHDSSPLSSVVLRRLSIPRPVHASASGAARKHVRIHSSAPNADA